MMRCWMLVAAAVVVTVLIEGLAAKRVARQIVFDGPSTSAGGGACDCQLLITCAIDFDQISSECTFADGTEGVCCPPETQTASFAPAAAGTGAADVGMLSVDTATRFNVALNQPVDTRQLQTASDAGLEAVRSLSSVDSSIISSNQALRSGTPASGHFRQSSISARAREMDRRAFAIVSASSNMIADVSLSTRTVGLGLRNIRVSGTPLEDQCPPEVSCIDPNSRFRTADGSCNNLRQPSWGMSNTPAQRILPPIYDDGVSALRTRGVGGVPLPNERNISSSILVDLDRPDPAFTLSVMQWAQFMDHDFAHIPFPSLENGEGIDCCSTDHPRCAAIDITGDRFYSQFGRTCMNFVRSMLGVGTGQDCRFGFAEQLNQLTHWIDGSNVYGSTPEEARAIRSFTDGLLSTSPGNFLPFNPNQGGECEAELRNAICFLAGESRVNEQPGLTTMHILWLREHNRVARELKKVNPRWSDEELYQESRRILIAEIQHITFNEWLPIIVGPRFVRAFNIGVRRRGFSNDYDPSINPNMNNEFSTAAFRFGHSLVQGTLALFAADGSVSTVQLRNNFNSPHLIQNEGRFDDLVRSLVQFAGQRFDNFITQDLSNHLFQTPEFSFGMDLMSINIHRGRDHGIATYNSIREVCGLRRAREFRDLRDQIHPRVIQQLQKLYNSVDDIDYFVGGISETPIPGSLLGWTFTCVVGDQFARLKRGDRYFYDLANQAGSFTEAQLNEIRKTSWARIICDNSNVGAVQPLAFQLGTRRFNRPRSCRSRSIPSPNFQAWGVRRY